MKPVLQSVAKRISFAAMFALMLFVCENASAQNLVGGTTYTIDNTVTLPANLWPNTNTFTGFAAAVSALNGTATDAITSTVTFNVTAGQTFQETPAQATITYLNATNGSPTCQIIFQKSGSGVDPVISGITGGGGADAVITITGGNYYTFNGIDLQNDPGNNTSTLQMELGLNLIINPGNSANSNNITYENGKISLNNYSPIQPLFIPVMGITDCISQNTFGSVGTVNISGNTINIGNCGYNGDGVNCNSFGANSVFQNNVMVLASGAANGGTVIGILGSIGASTTISNNSFTLSTIAQKGGFGLSGTTVGNSTNIYQNTIAFTGGTTSGTSGGIIYSNAGGTGISIYGNSVGAMSVTTSSAVTGISAINLGANSSIGIGPGNSVFGNTITNLTAASGTQPVIGIIATGMGANGVISNNIMTSIAAAGVGAPPTGISAASMGANCIISNNTITAQTISSATGAGIGILASSMGTGGTVTNNNITVSTGTTGAGTGINMLTATGTTYNIAGNTLSVTSAGAALGITAGVLGAGSNISNNLLTLVKTTAVSGTVACTGISSISMGASSNILGNTLTSVATLSGNAGVATGITTGSAAQAMGANSAIQNNKVTVSLAGSGAGNGIIAISMGADGNINNNTLSVTAGTGAAIGFSVATLSLNVSLFNNNIVNVSSTGAAATGISGTSTTTNTINIFGNTMGVQTAAGAVIGISELTLGSNSNVYGNSITATSTAAGAVTGILSTTAATNGSNINFYGNTINATSSSAASATPVLGISISDNFVNSIYNNSVTVKATTATGTGIVAEGVLDAGTGINYIYGNTASVVVKGGTTAVNAVGVQEAATGIGSQVYSNTPFVNNYATTPPTVTFPQSTALANATNIYVSSGNATANPLIFNNTITNYKSGTITTNGTSTVSGTGTKFTTEISAGDVLTINGVIVGTVLSTPVADNSLTLTSSASGLFANASNVNYAVPVMGSAVGIGASGSTSCTIYGNTINGLSTGSNAAGTSLGIYTDIGVTATLVTIYSNIVQNIYSVGANAGGIYGFKTNVSTYGNTVSNVASGGGTNTGSTGNSFGIYTGSFTLANVYGNTISNIYNFNTGQTTANAYGLFLTTNTGGICYFYNNNISNIHLDYTTSTGEATGIVISLAVTSANQNTFVHDNKIFNITNATTTATGNANGFRFTPGASSGNTFVYNNFIYDINANGGTLATSGGASRGVYVSTQGSAYSLSFYYNTIYLDGTDATSQTSSAMYLSTNGIKMAVWDNILVNATTTTGTSNAYALWCFTSSGLQQLVQPTTLSNNLLYAGTPSANHLLLYQSCSAGALNSQSQTINDYQTAVASKGDATTSHTLTVPLSSFFASPTAPIDVHLKSSGPIDASSQGSTAANLLTALNLVFGLANPPTISPYLSGNDIDGDPRSASGNTTIGADEAGCSTPATPGAFITTNSSTSTASFTGTANGQSSAILTIGGTITGTFGVGQTVTGDGLAAGTIIVGLITGTGGAGTYLINNGQTIGSGSINSTTNLSPSTICKGATNQVYAVPDIAGAIYNWTVPVGVVITFGQGTNSIGVDFLPNCASPAVISVTTTTACGTSTAQAMSVTVNPTATFGSISGPVTACQNAAVSYLANIPNAVSYLWTIPGTATSGSLTNASLLVNFGATAGANALSVVGTDACGNTVTLNYTVTVSGITATATTPTASASPSPLCSGSTLSLTGGPGSMAGYSWTGPNGFTSASQSPSISGISTLGSGTYILNITDANGCALGASTASVVVNALPTASAGGILPATCLGSTTVALGGSFGGSATSAIWSDGGAGGTFANNGGLTPGITTYTSSSAPVTLTLTTSGGSCGFLTPSKSLTINASPTLAATPISANETSGNIPNDGITCTGDAVSLTANVATGASPYTYLWTSGSVTNPYSISPSPTTGSPSYSVTVTDHNGCTVSGSTSLTVNALPLAPTFTIAETSGITNNDGTICNGDAVTLGASSSNGYSWSPGSATTQSITVSPASSTTYTVNITDVNGCTASGAQPVTVNALPPVAVNPISSVCKGGILDTLKATGAATYVWSPTTNLSPSAGTSATETVQISQLTFYTVTGTDANNCSAQAVVPVATVAIGGTISPIFSIICSGGTKTLTVTGAAGHDYIWEMSTNNSTWDTIPGAINTTYTTASGDGNTNKFYRLLARSNSCWNVASTTSEVDVSNPTITVTATSITDNTLILNWSPTGTGNYNITYSGTSSGFQTGVTPPKVITGLTANGTYSLVVTQTGVAGCSATGTVNANTLCAEPTNLTATPSTVGTTQELTVSWSGPAGNYRVYYRPLYSYITFFTQDVTNATTTILKKQGANNLYASNTYQIYVSRLDCPNTGNVGQPTSSIYVTTLPNPVVSCATPTIDTVFSSCPVLLEVQLHGSPTGNYNVYIQRLTPTLQAVNSYSISSGDFVINALAGQQYLISADSRCGSTVSTLNIWHNQVTVKPICNAPGNLVLSNPTCHGFTASWNADQCISNTISGYDFYMRQAGSINYNAYAVPLPAAPVGPHLIVTTLGEGKNMQAFVQSVYSCGGSVTYGPSSQVATITTLSAGCRDEETTDQPQENKPAVQQYSANNDEVFSLYPNPNTGEFTVDLSRLNNNADEVRIEVMNMIGQTVITQITSISDGHMRQFINLPNGTAAGTYIVRLTAGKNVYTAKINISK